MQADFHYTKNGQLKYHPDLHAKRGRAWTNHEQLFLIENYFSMGPEQVSFALERPIGAVMRKYSTLRKKGIVSTGAKRRYHRRLHEQAA